MPGCAFISAEGVVCMVVSLAIGGSVVFGGIGRWIWVASHWVAVPTEAPKSAHWFADTRVMQGMTVGSPLVGVPSGCS